MSSLEALYEAAVADVQRLQEELDRRGAGSVAIRYIWISSILCTLIGFIAGKVT